MAVRARLSAPREQRSDWPWHEARWGSLPISKLGSGERRLEADAYLASGFGIRTAIESRNKGWVPLGTLVRNSQPPRLKGIEVGSEYGSSIPHLDPEDVRNTPIVRLVPEVEDRIADAAEAAVRLRSEADQIENDIADEAERVISRFLEL